MITIPIFYAIDDNYSKFVYVSIKSLIANRNKGYNIRYDSEGKCFVSDETREKISNRLKKEWKEGKRREFLIGGAVVRFFFL